MPSRLEPSVRLATSMLLFNCALATPAYSAVNKHWRLDPADCQASLDSVRNVAPSVSAKADEIVSWISMTHPILHESPHLSSTFLYDLPHVTTGFAFPPAPEFVRAHAHFSKNNTLRLSTRIWGYHLRPPLDVVGAEMKAQLPDQIVERLILRNAQIMKALAEEAGSATSSDSRPILDGSLALWDAGPLRQKVHLYWYDSFKRSELLQIGLMRDYLNDDQVVAEVARRLCLHLPAIMGAQRALTRVVNSLIPEGAIHQKVWPMFMRQPEYAAVEPLAFKFGEPAEAEIIATPTVSSSTVPPVSQVDPFDLSRIERFVESSTPEGPADFLSVTMSAFELLHGGVIELSRVRSQPVDWDRWLRTIGPAVEWSVDLGQALVDCRSKAVVEGRTLEKLKFSFEKLKAWSTATRERLEALTNVDASLVRLMQLDATLNSAMLLIDQRLRALARGGEESADVSVLITHLELARVAGDVDAGLEPVRRALESLRSGGREK